MNETDGDIRQPRRLEAARSAAQSGARRAWDAARLAGRALWAFWQVARPILRWTAQIVLALLILLEEWGWQPLADLLGRLARWRPWACWRAWASSRAWARRAARRQGSETGTS